MTPVAIPADRRFHRAHVKPSRRRGVVRTALWPLAKYALTIAVLVIAAYRGFVALSDAAVLRIDRILVRGNARMSAAQVQSVLGGLRGHNIVFTDLEEWRQQLMRAPWVRDAAFKRTLPSTIEVSISEREPLGIGRVKDRLFLVDERGSLIDDYGPQYHEFDLPIIDGLQPMDRLSAGPLIDPRGELAARVVMALRAKPAVARRVSQIDVTDLHNAALIVDNDPALIYVGEDRFLARLESYLGLATALRERVAGIDYVDLRFDERIFVRPTKQRGGPTTVSGVRARQARAAGTRQ
jgi:cell division septal protein FtsQ